MNIFKNGVTSCETHAKCSGKSQHFIDVFSGKPNKREPSSALWKPCFSSNHMVQLQVPPTVESPRSRFLFMMRWFPSSSIVGWFQVSTPWRNIQKSKWVGIFPNFSGWKYKICETTTRSCFFDWGFYILLLVSLIKSAIKRSFVSKLSNLIVRWVTP